MSTRKKRTFSEEFRRDAVSLIEREGYTLKEASERLGIHESILGKWKRRLGGQGSVIQSPSSEGDNLHEEVRRLRIENRRLQMEREILKKATAFFAKESL